MHYLLQFILITSSVISLSLGVYVLLTKRKARYAYSFFTFSSGISIWVFSNFLFQQNISLFLAYLMSLTADIGGVLMIGGLYFFTKNFMRRTSSHMVLKDKIIIAFALILILLTFVPNVIEKGVAVNEMGKKYLVTGDLKVLLFAFVIILMVLMVRNVIFSLRRVEGLQKTQLQIFLWTLVLSMGGAALFNVFLPLLGNYNFVDLGPALSVCVVLGSFYCMLNYRFTDIRLIASYVVEKGVFLLLVLSGILAINTYAAKFTVENVYLFWISTVSIYFIALLYIYDFVRSRAWPRYIFAPNFDFFLTKFEESAITYNSVEVLVKHFENIFCSLIKVNKVSVLLNHQENLDDLQKKIKILFEGHPRTLFIQDEEIKKCEDGIEDNKELVDELQAVLKGTECTNILILKYLNRFVGYILFSGKRNGQAFTKYEIDFFMKLSEVFSVYLYKLQLYQQKVSLNRTLKHRINKATKKIQKQKDKLQEKYQFEKDMMGILGHELRTPMTVAKGMSELILAKVENESISKEYLTEKASKIHDSILKEADLIQTMLSTSHVENNKVNLQMLPVNVVDIIDYSVSAFRHEAEGKGLRLDFDHKKLLPEIICDPNRLQEIMNNLVSNAVKYTNEGSISIITDISDEYISIHVKDTGIGIPESEITNIGKKFYRVHQHLDHYKQIVRAGGTGLGMYVVKGLIRALKGKLLIVSDVGVGSTFTIMLPRNNSFKEELQYGSSNKNSDMFNQLGLKTH